MATTKMRWDSVREHLDKVLESIDEKNDTKSAIQHLFLAVGWIADEVFLEKLEKIKQDEGE